MAPPFLKLPKILQITRANPAVVTSNAHGFSNGDWVYIASVGGMTQVNGKYYIVAGVTANTFQLKSLRWYLWRNVNLNSTGYGAYTAGGTVARVYKLSSPFGAAELALVKFAQNVNTMVMCHPNHPPQLLTLLQQRIGPCSNYLRFYSNDPGGTGVVTTLAAGAVNYAYAVTAVDANGQESAPSAPIALRTSKT
jgi:hypothetical protein